VAANPAIPVLLAEPEANQGRFMLPMMIRASRETRDKMATHNE
jgi:hypothetical protein